MDELEKLSDAESAALTALYSHCGTCSCGARLKYVQELAYLKARLAYSRAFSKKYPAAANLPFQEHTLRMIARLEEMLKNIPC